MITPLTDKQAREAGARLAEMLDLTPNEEGRYNTSWGTKTLEGLGRSAQRIVDEIHVYDED